MVIDYTPYIGSRHFPAALSPKTMKLDLLTQTRVLYTLNLLYLILSSVLYVSLSAKSGLAMSRNIQPSDKSSVLPQANLIVGSIDSCRYSRAEDGQSLLIHRVNCYWTIRE